MLMKVLIDIPQEIFKATQTYYSDFTTRLSMKTYTEIIANGTPIPEGATNGDMIKAMFPLVEVKEKNNGYEVYFGIGTATQYFNHQWWNAPYKKESEGVNESTNI